MFERFTDQARRVIVLAQENALRLNHGYIGSEHILLGLLDEGDGAAARALSSADITVDAARREVDELTGQSQPLPPSGHIPFTSGAKNVMEFSLRECVGLGDSFVSTGHLLLGLIRDGDSPAIQVLGRLGANLDNLREQVRKEIRDHPERRKDLVPPRQRVVPPPDAIAGLLDEIEGRLDAIEGRLDAIEQNLGSDEFTALRAEVARLTALLREHGIDPGEPGDPPLAAG